jgi:phosphatidylserine/phosphatidylglycerophosphate/cardiolipin synthase-like enzyme
MYQFTSHTLSNALVAAKQRGVNVRVIVDGGLAKLSTSSQDHLLSSSGVTVKRWATTGSSTQPKFHHKFAVVDGTTVVTGSFNWTASADRINYENSITIHSATMAQAFSREFDSLWTTGKGGVGSAGDVVFAPTGSAELVEQRIATELGQAQHEIVLAEYLFTSKTLVQAVESAIQRGVAVSVLMDANQDKSVPNDKLDAQTLKSAGASLRLVYLQGTGGYAAKFHDKFCVIDGKTVITGSFNWDPDQDQRGWDNLVVLRDPALAQTYVNNFKQVWASPVAH